MKTIILENFRFGLDTRRSSISSQLGTLTTLENCFVNQGAEIENRKAFVKLGTLTSDCFDLVALPNGLVTFGSASPPVIPAGLSDLVSYQRIRHPYWALDTVTQPITNSPHVNPNRLIEPVLESITHSCAFNGKAYAIANFSAEQGSGLDTFDDYFSGTFYYYNGMPVLNCLQGRLDFGDSLYSGGGASNYYLAYLFAYYATKILGDAGFSFVFAVAADVSVNITAPIPESFAFTVSDTTNGQLTTQLFTTAQDPVDAIGAKVTIYLTKSSAGTKNVSVLTAPNVVNGAVSGTVDLLSGATVTFNTSLLQTAIDIAKKVNASGTNYSAQATIIGTTVAQLTISAPPFFGAIVNASNLSITSSNINISATSLNGSGTTGAQTFPFALGVTSSEGAGQVQRIIFNVPTYPIGSYEATLNFNGIDYTMGRGNITTRRATAVFYLISGSSGSVGPITWVDGTNLLNAGTVAYNTSLLQTAKDVIYSIVSKWNPVSGQYRYDNGIRDENTWLAYLVSSKNDNGDTIYGVQIVAPEGEQYNGENNLTVISTTLLIGDSPNAVGINSLSLSVDGATGTGTYLLTLGAKLYMARGLGFNFSSVGDATKWEQQDAGAGFITSADQSFSPSNVLSLARYQGKIAAFCSNNIQIWNVNADPTLNSQLQNISNIGTIAPFSVQELGEMDVLFLYKTGVRSLRVRETTLNAVVTDIGSPIDLLIQAALLNGSSGVVSIVEPTSNTYWLYLNGTIYVLSYYPSLKITAWSTFLPTYDIAGVQTTFIPTKMVVYAGQVYILDNQNNVFVYGGTDNNTYDGAPVTVTTPWLDDQKPSLVKGFESIDVGMSGKWTISCGCDPYSGTLESVLTSGDNTAPNSTKDSTFDKLTIPYNSNGTHFRMKAVSNVANVGVLKLSSLSIKYEPQNEK